MIIVLLTFFVVRAFKSKYRLDTDCSANNWIDALITILTLTTILLGSLLVISSLKYVSESENSTEQQSLPAPSNAQDRVEDFIRRNSQQHQQMPPTVTITRNPSVTSGSWLSAVRTEAYETQRRMSMAPSHNLKIDAPKWMTGPINLPDLFESKFNYNSTLIKKHNSNKLNNSSKRLVYIIEKSV